MRENKKQALVITEGTIVPPSVQPQFHLLPEKQRITLEAMLDPENIGLTVTHLCEKIGINRVYYYKMLRKKEFQAVLIAAREALYPVERSALARRIVYDAMTPLNKAFYLANGPKGPEMVPYANALVKTREQAATVLGLDLKPADVKEVKGTLGVLHELIGLPREKLEEIANRQVPQLPPGPVDDTSQ